MSIKDTRACINAILDGSIKDSEFNTTITFRLKVPKTLGDIEPSLLNPRNAWPDKAVFDTQRDELAAMFIKNFHRYDDNGGEFDYASAGPQL